MALKSKDEIFEAVAFPVTFTPREGESARVTRIEVDGGADDEFATVQIDRRTVGHFALGVQYGRQSVRMSHLQPVGPEVLDAFGTPRPRNIFDVLQSWGMPLIYPVHSGEDFVISFATNPTRVLVTYDLYDQPDVVPTEKNGSQSADLTYLKYLDNGAAIPAAAVTRINNDLSPAELPDFPTDLVPANREILVHALLTRAFSESTGNGVANTSGQRTLRARLFHEREVLKDVNRQGWPCVGQIDTFWTAAGTNSSFQQIHNSNPMFDLPGSPIHRLDPPLRFGPGEQVLYQIETQVNSAAAESLEAGDLLQAMLLQIRPVGGA